MVAPFLLLRRRTTRLACRWSVDYAVLGQSTPRRTWRGSLAPLLFLRGTDGILLQDGATHELVEGPVLEGHQLLIDLGTHPLAKQGCLLCIRVDVVHTILCRVYEPLLVLIHSVGSLLKVQLLLQLAVHQVIRDVVPSESLAELCPWHMIAIGKGGGEGHPPGTHNPVELLGREHCLLRL
jgi:hypothetical protein